jgi:hypothetical protein
MENASLIDIKKLFTKHGGVNFFNEFTLLDVEDAKKKVYFYLSKDKPSDTENIKAFLERGAKQIMEEKFMMGFEKPVGAVIKNTVRDNLNPDYKNTLKRLICIDSQYRPNLYPYNDPDTNECDFIVNLSEKLINVVNIQIENVQIPYTFYNVERRKGNNYFFIDDNLIDISDGHYNLKSLVDAINIKSTSYDVSFNLDVSLQKVSITNNKPSASVSIVFFDSLDNQDANEANTKNTTYLTAKGNHNLGWMLGFRNVLSDIQHIELSYTIPQNSTITAEAIANITTTKYFTIVVNDYNQNQANGTVIQTKLESNYIKPTTYFNFQNTPSNKSLECLNCDNISEYISAENRTLTKAQLYTRAEVNKYKSVMNLQTNYRLDCKTQNQVLAIIPFESKTDFGSIYFSDKIDFKREYHGPVDIEKLHVQLFDDKGLLMDLNGNDWYITLYTEHLYKY